MSAVSHLRSLQALDVTVRTGSLAAAAEVLGISPAAVGQRIKALEDYLGAELLLRGRAGIRPSPALAAALPHLASAFAELDKAAAALELQRGHDLHLSAPVDFVDLWLGPRLPAFRAAYPRIRFSINGEGDAPMRLGRADCRIEFMAGEPGPGTEPLLRDFVVPVGTPRNVDRTAALPFATRLEDFPLLHVDAYKDDPAGLGWREWIGHHRLERSAPERGMRFRRVSTALDSVLADAGFALIGLALLQPLIEAGRVASPYPLAMGRWTEGRYLAAFANDWERRAPLRAFRLWLLDQAAAARSWLEERVAGAQL